MTQSLVAAEIHEANTHLARLAKLSMPYTILSGGSLVCGLIGVPFLALRAWLENQSPVRAAFIGAALVGIGLLGAKIIDLRKRSEFNRIRACALKLERAGFSVYKKEVFAGIALDATESILPESAVPLKFESLSLHQFEAALEL